MCGNDVVPGAVEYQNMHRDGGVEIKVADGSLPQVLYNTSVLHDLLTWPASLLRRHNRHSESVTVLDRSQLPNGGEAWRANRPYKTQRGNSVREGNAKHVRGDTGAL